VLVPDDERLAVRRLVREVMAFLVRRSEHLAIHARIRRIRRSNQLLTFGAEDRPKRIDVARLCGGDERLDGFIGRRERPLRGRLRGGPDGQRERDSDEDGSCHRRLPPPPRELLRLLCPRWLDDRCDFPLEYPENASELLLLRCEAEAAWPLPL